MFRTGSQGLGSGKIPMINSIIELSLRIIACLTLPKFLGYMGICLTSPMAWTFAGFTLPFLTIKLYRKIEKSFVRDAIIDKKA